MYGMEFCHGICCALFGMDIHTPHIHLRWFKTVSTFQDVDFDGS